MLFGHLQVLFYARPPTSHLLFKEPGNTPNFGIFGITQLFDMTQLQGPTGQSKYQEKGAVSMIAK